MHHGPSGGEVGHRYDTGMKGFSAKVPESFLGNLKGSDIIDYIGELTIR